MKSNVPFKTKWSICLWPLRIIRDCSTGLKLETMNNSTKNQKLFQVLETNDRQRELVIMKALKAFKRNVNECFQFLVVYLELQT